MKRLRIIPWILAIIVAGCVPTRYSWSPDGKWMTVITPDGLRLADESGKLLPVTIPGVNVATWFPDSKRLLVSRKIDVKTWNELTKYLSPPETQAITIAAQRTRDGLMKYDWTAPAANDWKAFADWKITQDEEAGLETKTLKESGVALGMYVRDHADAALRQKVPTERWAEIQDLAQTINSLEIYSVDPFTSTPVKQITAFREVVNDLRVSPTGAAAIVTTDDTDHDEKHACSLWVFSLGTDGWNTVLSDRAAWYSDWSPDGRDVISIRSAQTTVEDTGNLGSVTRQRVIDDDGKFIKTPSAPQDLAGVVYNELSRVRCLKDGRIVFASLAVSLPTAAKDMPDQPELFCLTPGQTPMVSRLMPKQTYDAIGDLAYAFEISPDGQYISIPDKSGTVSVVDLRTGDATAVQDKPVPGQDANHNPTLFSVPQWRSNDELTLVAPGQNGHPSVVLWSLSKNTGKTLSDTWPAGSTDGDSSTTQPTTSTSQTGL